MAVVDSLADLRSAYVGEARLIEARALLAGADTAGARAAIGRALPALRYGAGAEHPRGPGHLAQKLATLPLAPIR